MERVGSMSPQGWPISTETLISPSWLKQQGIVPRASWLDDQVQQLHPMICLTIFPMEQDVGL